MKRDMPGWIRVVFFLIVVIGGALDAYTAFLSYNQNLADGDWFGHILRSGIALCLAFCSIAYPVYGQHKWSNGERWSGLFFIALGLGMWFFNAVNGIHYIDGTNVGGPLDIWIGNWEVFYFHNWYTLMQSIVAPTSVAILGFVQLHDTITPEQKQKLLEQRLANAKLGSLEAEIAAVTAANTRAKFSGMAGAFGINIPTPAIVAPSQVESVGPDPIPTTIPGTERQYLTTTELQKVLRHKDTGTIRDWCRTGKIKAELVESKWRIDLAALLESDEFKDKVQRWMERQANRRAGNLKAVI